MARLRPNLHTMVFRGRLNAKREIKFTVGGNEFQTLITRPEKKFLRSLDCWSNNFYTIIYICGLVYYAQNKMSFTIKLNEINEWKVSSVGWTVVETVESRPVNYLLGLWCCSVAAAESSFIGPNPLHQFPRVASPQQVCNKLALTKVRCVCCVMSFPKFHYNDLLPTCCGLVSDAANYSDLDLSR